MQPTQLLLRKDRESSLQPAQRLLRKDIASAVHPQRNVRCNSKCSEQKRTVEPSRFDVADSHSVPKVPKTESSVNNAGNTLFVELKIGKKRCSALLDTGSEVTLLPKHLADLTQLNRSSRKLRAANGTEINIIGEWRTTVTMGPLRVGMNFIVSDQIDELLVGIDWLRENECVLSFADSTIELKGYRFRLRKKVKTGTCNRVILEENVTLPARSEMIVSGKVVYADLHKRPSESLITGNKECCPGVKTARCLVELGDGTHIPLRVLNVTNKDVLLQEGMVMCPLQEVEAVAENVDESGPESAPSRDRTKVEQIKQLVEGVHPDASAEHVTRLQKLLTDYEDILSKDEFDMGLTDLIQHDVDTGQERPVRQALRRTPMVHNQVIDTHIQSMVKQGLIEPSHGEWSSNIVLVLKKDKSYRFCLDYRQLNRVTRKDVYPLPRIDASLDALAGSSWFSTLDLRSGYYQVPLNPKDAHKTAFIARSGYWQWRVLPMGLCNSASTFQRLMNMVLSGLTYKTCLVYLDDIIVMASSLDEHLARLEEVFSRIRAAKLKLRPDKCSLLQKEVTFLGHVVSAAGIAMDERKLEAVRSWETPKNLKETRSFVGFCAYYRRYVRNFSAIAKPLHALTKKNVRFEWSEECQAAFDELKRCLTAAPVVSLPRDEGDYILDTDASGWSMGAVLSQVQDGHERVISYGSKLFSRSEANYCVTRRELLAVVFFVKYFKQYLLGRKFTIRTDHAALQWLKRTPDPVGQQARWLEQLAPFEFDIVHRPGVRHGNADGMSRLPCRQCGRQEEEAEMVAPVTVEDEDEWSPTSLATRQLEDPEIAEFRELKKRNPDRKPTWSDLEGTFESSKIMWTMWSEFRLIDDVLYRETYNEVTQDKESRLVVPRVMRHRLIQMMHEGITGGHAGIARTKDQVRRRAYWPGWTKSVELFVKSCAPCSRYQRGRAPKQGQLRTMLASCPWETLGIDVTGPHPKSTGGHVYILTIIDHFSKFAMAYPMRNQEASTIANILVEKVICLVGTPTRILTDQGPNFESNLFRELCKALGVAKVRTSPYEASTNGITERLHLTMNSMIAKVIKEDQRDWHTKLPMVMAAYNATCHSSTSLTPNFIIFGRENVMPADLILCNPGVLPPQENSVVEYVLNQQEKFRAAYETVRNHLKAAAVKRKAYYDANVRARHFQEGDRVWYFYPRQYTRRSKKWSFAYVGPYTVLKRISDLTYQIQKSRKVKPIIVHVDKLKRCTEPTAAEVGGEVNTVWTCRIGD